MTDNLDEALKLVLEAKQNNKALSVGLIGNAGEILPEILKEIFFLMLLRIKLQHMICSTDTFQWE